MRSSASPALLLALISPLAAACGTSVVSTAVGPEGGTVTGPDGAQIIVPAGALTAPTDLTVRKIAASAAPALGAGFSAAGDVYSFEPHGIAFALPVEVHLPVAAGGASILHSACAAGSAGAGQCQAWDAPLSGVSFAGGAAVFSTAGFSLYTAVVPGGGTGGAGGGGTGGGGTGGTGGGGPGGCSGVYDGDFDILTVADVATLAPYCEVTGNVRYFPQDPADLVLPNLQRIDGDFHGQPTAMLLKSIHLPALTHVHSFLVEPASPELAVIELPSLAEIDGDFVVAMGQVPAVSLPALHAVGGSFTAYGSTAIIDAPGLASIGGALRIANTAFKAPALTTVGGVLDFASAQAQSLDLPALTSVGATLGPLDAAIDFDPWVGGIACYADNGSPLLTSLHLPALASLGPTQTGGINAGYTPLLPKCQIDALIDQLYQAGWLGMVTTASASCATSPTCM
jgi:hypothetical protein